MNLNTNRCEKLLQGFEPDFDFEPVPPLPREEHEERVSRIRVEAAESECDALILHTDPVGWYHVSNAYLRYVSDWIREGVLIMPTDRDKPATILSFFSDLVLLPPPGEPTWIDDIRQVGIWGREHWDHPADMIQKLAVATKEVVEDLGISRGKIGLIGDRTSTNLWSALSEVLPQASFENQHRIIDKMQHVKSKREQDLIRGAAQLIDIGYQAACYVCKPGVSDYEIFAAFTFAQMARGGESGDGYQMGINKYGTHVSKPCGRVVEPGDIVNLYISGVTYRGYNAQAARMILVGDISRKQEEVIEMCIEGFQKAMKATRPGALIRDVNNVGFEPFIKRGFLASPEARDMPWNWSANPDGSPRLIPCAHQQDDECRNEENSLRHVYPATLGPNGPRLGHSIGMPGLPLFRVISSNYRKLVSGMTFVVHPQWYEPKSVGCNLGSTLLVTDNGVENLNNHSSLEPHRVKA